MTITRVSRERYQDKEKLIEPELPVLQAVKKNYATALNYRTCWFANKLTKYGATVFRYFAKIVKKVSSKMKAHLFNPKDLIFLIKFLATFKLACGTNHVHEKVAIFVMPHYIKKTVGNACNSRVFRKTIEVRTE